AARVAADRLLLARRTAQSLARSRPVRNRMARGAARWWLSRLSAPRRRVACNDAAAVRLPARVRPDRQRQVAFARCSCWRRCASPRPRAHRASPGVAARRPPGRTTADAEIVRERTLRRPFVVRSAPRRLCRIGKPQDRHGADTRCAACGNARVALCACRDAATAARRPAEARVRTFPDRNRGALESSRATLPVAWQEDGRALERDGCAGRP